MEPKIKGLMDEMGGLEHSFSMPQPAKDGGRTALWD